MDKKHTPCKPTRCDTTTSTAIRNARNEGKSKTAARETPGRGKTWSNMKCCSKVGGVVDVRASLPRGVKRDGTAHVSTWRTARSSSGATQRHDSARKRCVLALSSASGASADFGSVDQPQSGTGSALNAFWRFLRPHTIRGTVLGTTALVARVLMENPSSIDWTLMPRALIGLLALLCGNGYIVGINQIYDEEIDRVNKPFLPVAAGDLTKAQAWILVVLLAGGGLAAVLTQFGTLTAKLYTLGLFLGTIYSVPPFRLKRYALPAFLIIAIVRGVLLNFGVYHATREALLLPFRWSPAAAFITLFGTVFATVIAITKDLADVEGDKKFNIGTFATALGVRGVAFLGSGLLLANYMGAIGAAFLAGQGNFRMAVMVGAHALFAATLVKSTVALDKAKYTKESVQEYYRAIWNLFYSEYLIFPFI